MPELIDPMSSRMPDPMAAEQAMPRLSREDLTFWRADSPMQPTTMAMLLVLDHTPEWTRLRHAVERAVLAVPRLRQRVVDAPLDLTLPHWAFDPTFDLDYHLRRHALGGSRAEDWWYDHRGDRR